MFIRYLLYILLSAVALQGASAPNLTVDANANRHAISPWIYGVNQWSDSGLLQSAHIPLVRWGGDDATSYNWQNSVKNNTGDNPWLYENYGVSPGFDSFHEANLRGGTVSLGTVSVMDWLPKAAGECSFSVKKYGAQKATNPDNPDCGNGILPDGTQVKNDPNDAYVPVTEDFSKQWVQHILGTYGAANDGGVRMWSMDNEPEWWLGNHTDVHPGEATYDDMMERNIRLATAVKAADPTALVTGPVPAGWPGMWFSRKDMDNGWGTAPYQYWDNPVDQKAHGGVPWIPYYLQQMQAFEKANGYRLLDVVDVHGYIMPLCFGNNSCTNTETLRLTSTREFWDPNYLPPGGGYEDGTGNEQAPRLVPRMRQWVADNYPDTMTAITEYNWGALDSITGAVAEADILGIFGREGLDLATVWGDVNPGQPGEFAFQIFTNYDGVGGQFGQTSVSATTDDADTLSIFAAQRNDSALTIMVLNKTASAITDNVSLANFTPAGKAQVWQYSSANLNAIVRQTPDISASGGSVSATFPAYSMTLFVIPANQSMMTVPQPVVTSVKSAASYDTTGVAPGEFVAIFGNSLGPQTPSSGVADASGKLTTNLGGTQVLFNGVAAPLDYVGPGQINAIVPYAAALYNSVNVEVINRGNPSAPFSMPVTAALPGLFTSNSSGSGQAAVRNQDNSINSASNPEKRGNRVQIFATGEGQTNPPDVDGRLAKSILPKPVLSCSATIDGLDATVKYCGAAPNFAGLVQINVVIPTSGVTPRSNVPVKVTIGTAKSQDGATIAVQ